MPVAARVRPDVWPGVSGPDRVPQVMSSLTRTIASQELCEAGSSRAAGSATSQIVAAATASMMLRIASGLGSPGSLSAKAPGSSSCACLAADTCPVHRQDRGGSDASFEGGGSPTAARAPRAGGAGLWLRSLSRTQRRSTTPGGSRTPNSPSVALPSVPVGVAARARSRLRLCCRSWRFANDDASTSASPVVPRLGTQRREGARDAGRFLHPRSAADPAGSGIVPAIVGSLRTRVSHRQMPAMTRPSATYLGAGR